MINLFNFSFITGFSIGIEFYTGDALMDGDKFAMTLDLGIVRLTYVITEQPA